MIPFLTACVIGVVLAARWQAGMWVLGAIVIAAFPLFYTGSTEAKATVLIASVVGYNLGLVAGLVLGAFVPVVTAPASAHHHPRFGAQNGGRMAGWSRRGSMRHGTR